MMLYYGEVQNCPATFRLVTDARVRRLRSVDIRTLVVGCTQSSFGDTSALEQFAV